MTNADATTAGEPKRLLDLTVLDARAASERGLVVELDDPRTSPTEILRDDAGKAYFIRILGGDSKKIRDWDRAIVERKYEPNGKKEKTSPYDDSVRDVMGRIAAATIEWYLPPLAGKTLACTEANALELYLDDRFRWIPDKLVTRIDDRPRFFSQTSSSS